MFPLTAKLQLRCPFCPSQDGRENASAERSAGRERPARHRARSPLPPARAAAESPGSPESATCCTEGRAAKAASSRRPGKAGLGSPLSSPARAVPAASRCGRRWPKASPRTARPAPPLRGVTRHLPWAAAERQEAEALTAPAPLAAPPGRSSPRATTMAPARPAFPVACSEPRSTRAAGPCRAAGGAGARRRGESFRRG